MRAAMLLMLLAGCATAVSPARSGPRSQAPDGFWDHWGDGRAEVSGYALSQPRYGTVRPGEAVLIFVTETLTHAQRVKSNGGHTDTFPVIKLNEVRDFQTGIYDYNLMTSAFVPLSGETPRGIPTRLRFSMQEWCGSTHADIQTVHAYGAPVESLHLTGQSYFDGEAAVDRLLSAPENGITEDALPVLVRGLVGPLLEPGESVVVPYLPRLADSRMRHQPLSWTEATLTLAAQTQETTVPAGTFLTRAFTATPQGQPTITYHVEALPPHRIIRWERDDGEVAVMTGSMRTTYWGEHGLGKASLRTELGLPTPTWP